MSSEILQRAKFSTIRYSQCWEDTDILLTALAPKSDDICLSIASGGDNSLALLTYAPKQVIAIDFNPTQIACLELKFFAYRELDYEEILTLFGVIDQPQERLNLYQKIHHHLSKNSLDFWDNHPHLIRQGINYIGKFERYLTLFRKRFLPLIHSPDQIEQLFNLETISEREQFYDQVWNNWRWQGLFKLFFSKFLLGKLGRDPSFFKYVDRDIATHLLNRTYYAMTQLNPSENPYLQWIALGNYQTALPYILRPENVVKIKENLDRFQWYCFALEDFLESPDIPPINCYNLSNIFEYMSMENYHKILEKIIKISPSYSRLAYWNLLAYRKSPSYLHDQIKPLTTLSETLYRQDKAFFYQGFIVEETL
jgi:S-adenosylmethionine-diacylglycerol 3-amino-3-carboxypropyl transferase